MRLGTLSTVTLAIATLKPSSWVLFPTTGVKAAIPTGKRLHVLVEDDEERPEEVVPVEGEHDHRGRDHRSARERKGDAPEEPERPRPVHPRRLLELGREPQKELPEDVDAEHVGDGGEDEGLVAARPADLDEREQHGDDGDLDRDHQRGEEHREDRGPPREPQAGEGVAGHGAEDYAKGCRRDRLDDAVDPPANYRVLEHPDVVVDGHPARQPLDRVGHHVARELERGRDHPDEGGGPDEDDEGADEPDRDVDRLHAPAAEVLAQARREGRTAVHHARSRSTSRCAMVRTTMTTNSIIAIAEA